MKNVGFKNIFIIIMVMIIGFVTVNNFYMVKADSGWDTDYGGGFDSGWDSNYDSGWDNDYDYDWDDDDDYHSSSGGGSYSSSDASDEEIFIVLAFAIIFMIFPIFAINAFFNSIKKGAKINESRKKSLLANKYPELLQENAIKVIPDFNVTEFNFEAYQNFYDVQMAWMEFDYDKLKELLTDELYNSYLLQLDSLKIKNHKNVMKDFVLIESHIYSLKEENNMYVAKVYLEVRFKDYVENKDGMVMRGSAYNDIQNTYLLTFIRTKEKTTNVNFCPRCGADVTGNVSGECEYCKAKLINKKYDWVMSKKEKIDQR